MPINVPFACVPMYFGIKSFDVPIQPHNIVLHSSRAHHDIKKGCTGKKLTQLQTGNLVT